MRLQSCLFVLVVACGGSSTGDDGGTDAANDGTTKDANADVSTDASNDAGSNDAGSNDAGSSDSSFGDGGLTQGAECDPNDNLCMPTLLCCSEPTHNFDGGPSSHEVCEAPSNGNCPLLP